MNQSDEIRGLSYAERHDCTDSDCLTCAYVGCQVITGFANSREDTIHPLNEQIRNVFTGNFLGENVNDEILKDMLKTIDKE